VSSHHVESMKRPECSHHGAVLVVLVRRADQQGALHACFHGPEKGRAGERDKETSSTRHSRKLKQRDSAPVDRPLDAVDRRIAEAPDVVVVAVQRAGGGKHQPVTGETGDLQDHHLLPEAAVHLKGERSRRVRPHTEARSAASHETQAGADSETLKQNLVLSNAAVERWEIGL